MNPINVAIGGKCDGQVVTPFPGCTFPLVELIVREIEGTTPAIGFEVARYEWRAFLEAPNLPVIHVCLPVGITNEEAASLVFDYLVKSRAKLCKFSTATN